MTAEPATLHVTAPKGREPLRRRIPVGWRIALAYVPVFWALGIIVPFWQVWLASRGLSPGDIGLVLAGLLGAKVVFNPAVGMIVDRTGRRRVITAALAAFAGAGFLLFPQLDRLLPILAVTVVAGGAMSALVPLAEGLAVQTAYARGLDYGRLRISGSVTFIAANIVGGWLLQSAGPAVVPWLVLAGLAGCVLVAPLQPDPGIPGTTAGAAPASGRGSWTLLLGAGIFWLFLAATGLLQASHTVVNGFGTNHWLAAGVAEWITGLLWAVGVLAEVVLFAFSGRVLVRIGPVGLLLLSAVGGVIRWTVLAATVNPLPVGLAQTLHALSFGAGHLGAMHYIGRHVHPSVAGRAQAAYASLSMGLGMGAGTLGAGALYGTHGGQAFLAAAVLSGLGGVLALPLLRRYGRT